MPQYKLIFQDASWQDRQFISFTRINDDGTANILHAVSRKDKDEQQISFGTYAKGVENRKLEFHGDQTVQITTSLNEKLPAEEMYSHLLHGNIMDHILRDDAFLEGVLQSAISGNHEVYINAAKKLQHGICEDKIYWAETQTIINYRDFIVKSYFEHLLNCNRMRVNAHPCGLYTVIQAYLSTTYRGAGVNDLPIDFDNAVHIYNQMQALLTSHMPGWPVIYEYRLLGTIVPHAGNGRYLQITELTHVQKYIVDSLFATAQQQHFFPTDPQKMIQKAWVEMGGKLVSPQQEMGGTLVSPGLSSQSLFAAPPQNASPKPEANRSFAGLNG